MARATAQQQNRTARIEKFRNELLGKRRGGMRKSTEEKFFKVEWLFEVAKKAAAAKSKAM